MSRVRNSLRQLLIEVSTLGLCVLSVSIQVRVEYLALNANIDKIDMKLLSWLYLTVLWDSKICSPAIQGVGLSTNITSIPAAVTEVRIPPRLTQECLWIRSSSRNRKKEERFPMTPDSLRIAQNIPEFLVIVSLSELWDRNVPWLDKYKMRKENYQYLSCPENGATEP